MAIAKPVYISNITGPLTHGGKATDPAPVEFWEVPGHFKLWKTDTLNGEIKLEFIYKGIKYGTSYYLYDTPGHVLMSNINDYDYIKNEMYSRARYYFYKENRDLHPKVIEYFEEKLYEFLFGPPSGDAAEDAPDEISMVSTRLPGVNTIVEHPCNCGGRSILWFVIQHLNDAHADWSREKIADWVDELHEAGIINAEFQPWGEVDEDPKEIKGHNPVVFIEDEASGWKEVGCLTGPLSIEHEYDDKLDAIKMSLYYSMWIEEPLSEDVIKNITGV